MNYSDGLKVVAASLKVEGSRTESQRYMRKAERQTHLLTLMMGKGVMSQRIHQFS